MGFIFLLKIKHPTILKYFCIDYDEEDDGTSREDEDDDDE